MVGAAARSRAGWSRVLVLFMADWRNCRRVVRRYSPLSLLATLRAAAGFRPSA